MRFIFGQFFLLVALFVSENASGQLAPDAECPIPQEPRGLSRVEPKTALDSALPEVRLLFWKYMSESLASHYILSICEDGNFTFLGGQNLRLYGRVRGRVPVSAILEFERRNLPSLRELALEASTEYEPGRGRPYVADSNPFPVRIILANKSERVQFASTPMTSDHRLVRLLQEIENLIPTKAIRCPALNTDGSTRDLAVRFDVCDREDELLKRLGSQRK